jgi:hypothetical protein
MLVIAQRISLLKSFFHWRPRLRFTRRALSFGLSLSMGISAVPACPSFAAPSNPRPVIVAEPYLQTCEGLLQAAQTEQIEKYFLSHVRTEGQAAQLLADYGLLASKDLREAILVVLAKRGIPLPRIRKNDSQDFPIEFRIFARKVLAVAQLPETEFQKFVDEVLSNFKTVIDGGGDGGFKNELHSLMITRFLTAMREDQNPDLLKVFRAIVRSNLLVTAWNLQIRDAKVTPRLDSNVLGEAMIVGPVSMTFVGLLLFLILRENFHYPASVGIVFGSASVGLLGMITFAITKDSARGRKYHAAQRIPPPTRFQNSQGVPLAPILGLGSKYEAPQNQLPISLSDLCNAENVCDLAGLNRSSSCDKIWAKKGLGHGKKEIHT